MAHSEGDDFLLSGEATGGGDSEEEIEVTAAEVLAQLEEVSFWLVIFLQAMCCIRLFSA